jgi:hypothetical protein
MPSRTARLNPGPLGVTEVRSTRVPKATSCTFNGRPMDIETALQIRGRKSDADFRCSECGERVRAHKKGTTGQEAHFEHLAANSRCSRSGPR